MFSGFRIVLNLMAAVLNISAAAWVFSSLSLCFAQPGNQPLTFKLADGLAIEQVAGEPLVHWPMLADWDFLGRLVVVESAGVAHPIQEHNLRNLHRLVRLVDDDGDGIMDRRILAADQLPFTEGLLCLGNSILITAPPHIWKLTDEDGDGFCEHREIWFDGQTITGCANDLHGPYLGRDGWIYWTKGAFAQQTHELRNGKTMSDRAAHLFRRHSSGGPIEPLMSGGMDNPIGFAVLPSGERFFSSTFLVHPRDGQRDGIVHSIYGGAYGKDHSALEGIVRTGPLMPIMSHLGPAAPSGLICLRSGRLTLSDQPTLAAALFNFQKVIALPLQQNGASYQSSPIDLVVGSRIDFHPTDVIEDADGSLLVIDTGGWYDLCCPSSRIDQQTAPGGIYRLAPVDHRPPAVERSVAVDWLRLPSNNLAELLDDRRPWIARSALLEIISRGDRSLPAIGERLNDLSLPLASRQNALWAMGAVGTDLALGQILSKLVEWSQETSSSLPDNPAEGETCFEASDCSLLQIACHLIALHSYHPAKNAVETLFRENVQVATNQSSSQGLPRTESGPGLARVAAEALGRIGDDSTAITLMSGAHRLADDRILDHSVRYALFEISSSAAVAPFLDSDQSDQVNLALSTLDLLGAEHFLSSGRLLSAANDPDCVETVISLLRSRPGLSGEVLEHLGPKWYWAINGQPPSTVFSELVTAWRDRPEMQHWLAQTFLQESAAESSWQWKQQALSAYSGLTLPAAWHDWLQHDLKRDPVRTTDLLSAAKLKYDWGSPLAVFLMNAVQAEQDYRTKERFLLSLPEGHGCSDETTAAHAIAQLSVEPFNERYWQVLRRLKISPQSAGSLIDLCEQLSPTELLRAIEMISQAGVDEVDQRLMQRLRDLQTARSLPRGILNNIYRNRSEPLRLLAQQLSDQLQQTDPKVETTVQEVLANLPAGDPVRGLTIYHGSKANCGACHQMGYRGGRIGPELTRIGASRTREALVEAIVFPSQRIEQGYHSTQILTEDGRILTGIVAGSPLDDALDIRISADRVERIAAATVEEMRPSDVSIMPGGMLELLSLQELSDLISLLEAAR